MNADVTIREVNQDDLEDLKALSTRPDLVEATVKAHIAGEAFFALVERAGALVGSGVLDLREQELQPELKLLYIAAESRREGLGWKLSTFLEDEARRRDFTAIYLAVDPNNEKMVPLAVELGYSATGEHQFVDDPDAEQVDHPSLVSSYYAIYRKSLTMA